MPRHKFAPRYIKPELIRIGDIVRITTQDGDMQTSNVGKVASRQHVGRAVEYLTGMGNLLGTDWRDGIARIKVTLIDRAEEQQLELEGMDI